MKKNYEKTRRLYCGLEKTFLIMLILFSTTQMITAQVSSYTFSQSNGSFNSITPTGTLVSGSEASTINTYDSSGWIIPLPFTFNFNGVNYTELYANSNGGVTFGATTSTSSAIISATTAYAGAIGVMNRDLWGLFYTTGVTTSGSDVITNVASFNGMEVGKQLNNVNGIPSGATIVAFDAGAQTITMSAPATSSSAAAVIRYGTGKIFTEVTGVAPNRVFTIEWIGYNDYSTSAATNTYLNFQLVLEESTNKVNIVYGPQSNFSTTSRTNQIGLRGATNADFNNRLGAVANPWSSTAVGTANSSTVSRDNTNFPAPGLTFTWTPPTCIAPSGFVYNNLGINSVDLAWTASPSSPTNGYEVYYSTVNTAPTTATPANITGVSTTTTSISSLNAETTYFVWVRSACNVSDISGWNSAGSFTTNCNDVDLLSENFDSYTTGSILPSCWARIVPALTPGSQTITSTTPASGTRNIFMSTATTANSIVVALPVFSNVNAGTHRLKLKARVTSVPGILNIGYVTSVTDASTFVSIEDLTLNNTVYTSGADYTVIVPNTVPTGARLAIKTPSDGKSYYFDDVIWEAIPSCLAPVNPSITTFTTNSLTVSWTAPSTAPAIGYDVYYSTTNTAPTAATVLDVTNSVSSTTTTATISGLPSDNVQFIWIRSNCTVSEQSVWISAGSANTGYCVPSTANQDSWISSFTSTTAATNMAYSSASGTAGGYKNATATNKITNYVGTTTPISITAGGPTTGISIWVDWNNNLIFETTERVYTSGGYVTTTSGASIAVPAGTANGNYRMRVIVDFNNTTPSNPCGVSVSRGEYVDYTFEVVSQPTDAVDFANLQAIVLNNSGVVSSIETCQSVDVYTQGYENGVTNASNTAAGTGIEVWIGRSSNDTDPATWTETSWTPAIYNVDVGNNDEFKVNYSGLAIGNHYFASRWRLNNGPYVYGATNNGFWNGTTNTNAVLTVTEPIAISTTANNPAICVGGSTTLTASSTNTNYTYLWNDALATVGNTLTVTPTTTTTYIVTGTDTSTGCTKTSSITIVVNALPTAATITASNSSVCANEIVTLNASSSDIVTLLSEGFENVVPPTNWTSYIGTNGLGTTYNWTSSTLSNTGTGAAFVRYESVTGGNAEDWLVTPLINLTNVTSPSLTFNARQGFTSDYGSTYFVKVSTTSATDIASFSNAASWTETTLNTSPLVYELKTVDLSAYVGQQVYVAFVMVNNDGDNFIIDDVKVTASKLNSVTWSPATNLYSDALATVPYVANTAASMVYYKSNIAATETITTTVTNSNSCVNTATTDITVNALTSNSTTITACDSYTWAENGMTYTASGTYTSVTGCNTETLNLTITTSSSLPNEVVSACDTYTWAANGTTYTTGGTYTSTTNCVTRTLNLTINASPSNATTQSGDTLSATETGATYQWLLCDGSFTPISGATSQSYLVTAIGSYAVDITKNGCTVRSACVNVTALGNATFDLTKLSYYPNPVLDMLTVRYSENITSIDVYDLSGRRVKNSTSNNTEVTLNMSDLAASVYVVKVYTEGKSSEFKIVKK